MSDSGWTKGTMVRWNIASPHARWQHLHRPSASSSRGCRLSLCAQHLWQQKACGCIYWKPLCQAGPHCSLQGWHCECIAGRDGLLLACLCGADSALLARWHRQGSRGMSGHAGQRRKPLKLNGANLVACLLQVAHHLPCLYEVAQLLCNHRWPLQASTAPLCLLLDGLTAHCGACPCPEEAGKLLGFGS